MKSDAKRCPLCGHVPWPDKRFAFALRCACHGVDNPHRDGFTTEGCESMEEAIEKWDAGVQAILDHEAGKR